MLNLMILSTNTISSLLTNGVTDIMWWCKWIIYAVGAVAILMAAVFLVQHFKNHGKGQSKLVPAIALLLIGCMCIIGGGALSNIGDTGNETLKQWSTSGGTANSGQTFNNPFAN